MYPGSFGKIKLQVFLLLYLNLFTIYFILLWTKLKDLHETQVYDLQLICLHL